MSAVKSTIDRRMPRWVRVALIAIAVPGVILAGVLLGVPTLIDAPAVKKEIEQQIAKRVQGRITWKDLDLRLLPSPRGVLRGVRIDLPPEVAGRIEEVDVRLRLFPLLRGHAEIGLVEVVRPVFQVRIARSAAGPSKPPSDPVVAYRAVMGAVVRIIESVASDAVVTIEQGSLELQADAVPELDLGDVTLHGQTEGRSMTWTAAAASNLWGRLKLSGRLDLDSLRGQTTLDITDLKPQTLLDRFVPSSMAVALPAANVRLDAQTDGKTELKANVAIDAPTLSLKRGAGELGITPVSIKAAVAVSAQQAEVALSEMRLGDLLPDASGALRLHAGAGGVEASAEVPALDLVKLRDAVLALAGDQPELRSALARLRSGNATDLKLSAKADVLDALLRPENITGHVTLAQVAARIPAVEQEATGVGGQLGLDQGTVTARSFTGRLGDLHASDAAAQYTLATGSLSVSSALDVDLAQTLALVRKLLDPEDRAALAPIHSITGRALARGHFNLQGKQWNAQIAVQQSSSQMTSDWLPWPARVKQGVVAFSADRVSVSGVNGSVGRSVVADGAVALSTAGPCRVESASGRVTPALDEVYPWLRSLKGLSKTLAPVKAVTGQVDIVLKQVSGPADEPEALEYEARVEPRRVQAEIAGLPEPVTLAEGAIAVDNAALVADGVTASLLDASAKVSGRVAGYRGERPTIDARAADGVVGEKLVRWIWRSRHLPRRLEPQTPIRLDVQSMQWDGKSDVEVKASARFETGTALGVDLTLSPRRVNVRRFTVKDKRSDASLALLLGPRMADARFKGIMYGSSIDAVLKDAIHHLGHGAGDLRIIIDRDRPEQTTGTGRFVGENMNLSFLTGKPVVLERVSLVADNTVLHIHEATLKWAEQPLTISGDIRHDGNALVVDARVSSPGIVVDALLPAGGPEGEVENPRTLDAKSLGWLWPLPVTGSVSVHADFVQYARYHFAPVQGVLSLERERADLAVRDAQLCGVSFPFTIQLTPEGAAASAHVVANNLGFQKTARCMSGERVVISGHYDLKSDLVTSGADTAELIDKLDGKVELRGRDGKIMKAPLLGNILSMKNVAGLFKNGPPKFDANGFPYKKVTLDGHFAKGRFIIDQSSLDSDAFGLVATGSIGVADGDVKLTVLVAPFGALDRLVRAVPLIGYIVGGTFTSVPVSVNGTIARPTVVPLGARAVSTQLLGIFERTLKLPGKMLDVTGTTEAAPTPPAAK